jgi:hypothetical protein
MEKRFMATRVLPLENENDIGIQKAIVRLHNSRVDVSKADPTRFSRREAVVLTNPANGASTLRFVMGVGAGISGFHKNAIAMDYDGRDGLGVTLGDVDPHVEVRKASTLEVYRHFLNHPDAGYRVATQLGVLGAGLGLLSLVITFILASF